MLAISKKNGSGYSCYESHIGKLWTHFSDWGEGAFFTVLHVAEYIGLEKRKDARVGLEKKGSKSSGKP